MIGIAFLIKHGLETNQRHFQNIKSNCLKKGEKGPEECTFLLFNHIECHTFKMSYVVVLKFVN